MLKSFMGWWDPLYVFLEVEVDKQLPLRPFVGITGLTSGHISL